MIASTLSPLRTTRFSMVTRTSIRVKDLGDGRITVAESLERGGEQWSHYVLIDDRGRLRADVKQVDIVNGSTTSEEWNFHGPGVRP